MMPFAFRTRPPHAPSPEEGFAMTIRSVAVAVMSAVLLVACASNPIDKMKTKETVLEDTLKLYASTIRWGDNMTQGLGFVDPEYLKLHPVSNLDLARYQQVRVTSYDDQPAAPINDNEVRQVVEISFINNNTQTMRSVVDNQVWRYDEAQKRWWLTTGLPDITRHD
jgi:hypothetical protein